MPIVAFNEMGEGWWFKSGVEAERAGFRHSLICNVIAGRQKYHKGFAWQKA